MGLMPNVGTGAVIQVTWGNDIRDRTRQIFASKAELDTQWPAAPNGAHAWTTDAGIEWVRRGGVWESLAGYVPWTVAGLGNGWINSAGNIPARYRKIADVVEVYAAIAGGADGTAAWTMPAGYRPTQGQAAIGTTAWQGGDAITLVATDGRVLVFFVGGATMYVNGSYSVL